MKVGELIDLWRDSMDDAAEPFLWSDDNAYDYANDAQSEYARRTRFFVESQHTMCSLTVDTTGIAALDARVLFVRRARVAAQLPMRRMNMQDMEACDPYWEDAAAVANPTRFIPDWQTGKLRFHPPPLAPVTVKLTVVRDPLNTLVKREDALEIPDRHARSLIHWMAYRAYSKPDKETYDPKKAQECNDRFTLEVGPPSTAVDEAWITREQMEGDGTF